MRKRRRVIEDDQIRFPSHMSVFHHSPVVYKNEMYSVRSRIGLWEPGVKRLNPGIDPRSGNWRNITDLSGRDQQEEI